ncbi:Retrovirus-related Pol polyprotein from transposon RE1 [Vitis vinifera]|uniref:Retrovirus-related Pol polyprotein from transposon RE1 n=1 Tax=Vitis vinifera TaxID=29760 RepID=A0A438KAY0_VITVI|nr:Retrovirus-related Pol polyprotein from transposon RE1 [Vitis vinifera]
MATKSSTFSSVISGSPMITSEKLVGSENYLSWSASVELWFMGQGYEDHLVTQEADIPEVDRVQWRKIDAQLYLETVRDQILGSSSVPSLDDVFAHLLRISSLRLCHLITLQILLSWPTRDRCYQLHGRPPRTAHVAQSSDPQLPQPPSSSTSQDSGASDHISGNKDLFSSIITTSVLPTVTLANGSQLWLKDRSTGKTIGIGHESQGLYHLTSPSPADKLSARATKCIFLGYSRLQKGYHCYSSETHRYFLSAHVTFFEDLPFFSTSESLPVSEVPADSPPIPSVSPAPALPPSTDLPIALQKVGCRWVYTVKVGPDGQVDRLKAHLVAKGYTQVYGSDYGDTCSPVAKIASVHLLLSMVAMRSWPLYQLDIKNVFLHGDLAKEVFMEQPPGFVAQGESGLCIYLVVYVDDIVITGSDQNGIQNLKQHFFTHFQTKDLGKLKYFLGIEIAQSSSGVVLFPKEGEPLGDPGRYRRLVAHPGQGVLYENRGHTQVVGYTDADWAGSPTDRRSTSGYCVFIGGNLISWKSKKQDVVARSSAEVGYRAMALTTCELIWLKHLLRELRFGKDEQMKLICDNQAALHITSNPVFHERTKHIEIDCHFIREKIASGCVATSFVNSNDQLADIFTKSLRGPRIKYICNKAWCI